VEEKGFGLEAEVFDDAALELRPEVRVAVVEVEGVANHPNETGVGRDGRVLAEVGHEAGNVGVPYLVAHDFSEPVLEVGVGNVDDAGFEAGTGGDDSGAVRGGV